MEKLATYLGNAKGNAFNVARYMRDIGGALDTLGIGPDKPFGKFISNITQAALDVTTIIGGFEALAELLKAETWTSILKDALKLITGIVTGIGQILSGGGGGGGGTVTNPNVATGAATQGAGAATTTAGGGVAAGVLTGLSTAAIGAIIGANINAIIQARGIEEPWTRMGITREEWIQQQIESGAYAQYLGNLMGPGSDLSWLSGASGGIGGLFGGTPSWLSGLQGYMGTGGSANTSGIMGSGSMGSTQTININLDGQQIATATVPYMAGELELYGTNY